MVKEPSKNEVAEEVNDDKDDTDRDVNKPSDKLNIDKPDDKTEIDERVDDDKVTNEADKGDEMMIAEKDW